MLTKVVGHLNTRGLCKGQALVIGSGKQQVWVGPYLGT